MKKLLALLLAAVFAVAAYVAAGPFLTINALRKAVETQRVSGLKRHVDFPVLRANLKAQLDDYVLRQAGADAQRNAFGAIALQIAGGLSGSVVDAMLTPAGIGAVLQGRNLWQRGSGAGINRNDTYAHTAPANPLQDPSYRYESTSRFTATVNDGSGDPLVLVLSRDGLRWKLTDIRLPLLDASRSGAGVPNAGQSGN